jgi:hypothetical protein
MPGFERESLTVRLVNSKIWSVATLGLMAAAWATFFLTRVYAFQLAARYGRATDVVDALGRDTYVGRGTLP